MPQRAGIAANMNRLTGVERAAVVALLFDGNTIRPTARMTGFATNTAVKLFIDLGEACAFPR